MTRIGIRRERGERGWERVTRTGIRRERGER